MHPTDESDGECLFCSVKIRNLWEILSGQHQTNAGNEFVNGVKAVEAEWVAQLGILNFVSHILPQNACEIGKAT